MDFATFFIIALLYVCEVKSQIAIVDLFPKDSLSMQRGIGMPRVLNVVEGNEALLRVEGTLEDMQSCVITTPEMIQFEVRSPPSDRFEAWSDGCGVRVHHVTEADEGRWRMNATSPHGALVGWSVVTVTKDTTSYTAPAIELLDGKSHTDVELTSLNNSYCVVTQPFSQSSLIPGHCRVTLDKATRAVQGNWDILLGLPGKVEEIRFQRRVAVEAERLDVGYVRDTQNNKLHLYCNMQNTEKNVTFCRFQKTSSSVGYNVLDGLSDGRHSYYGDGIYRRDCGLTIEQPTQNDYGTWRCSVGVQQWVGNQIEAGTPLQALISVGPETPRTRRFLTHRAEDDEIQTVIVQRDQEFTIMCSADVSLTYCWFQHPNGTSFTPVPIVAEDQLFWYTGESLQVGECGITFSHATEADSGLWTCHMGPSQSLGMEITHKVEVRVGGPLAASKKEIATNIGDTVNLICHTANGNRPLDYCRFLSPTGLGFRIDSTITEDNAFDRYFFMAGKSLDYGDCAITIKAVESEDLGTWTCAALIIDESLESWDTIEVYLDNFDDTGAPLSQAGIAGMAVGASVLIVILLGVALYKTGYLRVINFRSRRSETEQFALSSVNSGNKSLSNFSVDTNSSGSSNELFSGEQIELDVIPSTSRSQKND